MEKNKGTYIEEETGRVYLDGHLVGFGILEKAKKKVHMTHDVNGKPLEKRKFVYVD